VKKPRSISEFNDLLTDELSWRVKEIADLKLAIRTSDPIMAKSLSRACVPILYAHWEGYVKATANAYLDYLNHLGLPLCKLADCFVALGSRRKLIELSDTKDFSKQLGVVRFFLHDLNQKAPLKFPGAINTRSNLNSEVFETIASSIGLSTGQYQTRYNLIDERLLGNRNSIAHGDWVRMEKDQCRRLADDVIQLLREFNNDLYNLASTRAYRR
jgi:hypothetical protein